MIFRGFCPYHSLYQNHFFVNLIENKLVWAQSLAKGSNSGSFFAALKPALSYILILVFTLAFTLKSYNKFFK